MAPAGMYEITPTEARWLLGSSAASVGVARWHALAQLDAWGLAELSDTVGLVVSELVTNAVKAEGETVEVRLGLVDGGLLVEVYDADPRPPVTAEADPMDEGGRGLTLVGAYAADWGHRRCADGGKVVWAKIGVPGEAVRQREGEPSATADPRVMLPSQRKPPSA